MILEPLDSKYVLQDVLAFSNFALLLNEKLGMMTDAGNAALDQTIHSY